MPRNLPGNTPLGQEINKQGSGTDFVKIRQTPPPKTGLISDMYKTQAGDQYVVILKARDPATGTIKTMRPVLLADHPSVIAFQFGSPQDLIGKYWCQVTYTGPSYSSGTARIIRPMDEPEDDVGKWNELPIQGSAFAVPGAGQ
ncbi:MAG: hypothetical protein DRI46_09025 [Chloroflexi bacterium]|nr:MAG: hypothetical protein DRI46_09025 [Chloroflexota bacterium]